MDNAKWMTILAAKQAIFGRPQESAHWAAFAAELEGLSSADLVKVIAEVSPIAEQRLQQGLINTCRAVLDAQLVREQVAAQERMSAAADEMQRASVELAKESNNLSVASNELSRRSNKLTWATVILAVVAAIEALLQIWQAAQHH